MGQAWRRIAPLGALALLAGCDGNPLVDVPQGYQTFAAIEADAAAMAAGTVDLATGDLFPGVTKTDPGDLPASGSATYEGFVAGEVGGAGLIGALTLRTVFGTPGSVSGTADNFLHETNGAYGGTLAVSGSVSPTAPISQITASADGTLSNLGTDYPTQIFLNGNFIGTDYGAVAGEATGKVGAGDFGGGFVAER